MWFHGKYLIIDTSLQNHLEGYRVSFNSCELLDPTHCKKPPTLQEPDIREVSSRVGVYCLSYMKQKVKKFLLTSLLKKLDIMITRKESHFKRPIFILTDQTIRIHRELKIKKLILSDLLNLGVPEQPVFPGSSFYPVLCLLSFLLCLLPRKKKKNLINVSL